MLLKYSLLMQEIIPFKKTSDTWLVQLQQRCKEVLDLKIIDTVNPKRVRIWYENIALYRENVDEYGNEEDSTLLKNFGPAYVKEELTAQELFNYVLQNCGYSSVLNKSEINVKDINLEIELHDEEYLDYQNMYFEFIEEKIFLKTDTILSENSVLVESIIELLRPQFTAFLEKYENELSINHDMYISWLMSHFPSRIQVRKLE